MGGQTDVSREVRGGNEAKRDRTIGGRGIMGTEGGIMYVYGYMEAQ